MKFLSKHLNEKNMTYFQHFIYALKFSAKLLFLSLAAFVHAIFPFFLTTTVSRGIERLHAKLLDDHPGNGKKNSVNLSDIEEINKFFDTLKKISNDISSQSATCSNCSCGEDCACSNPNSCDCGCK